MRITVLGGTGNIGGEVVRQAAARGHQITAVARHQPARPVAGVTYVEGDLADARSYAGALTDVDALFSLPGYDGLGDSLAGARRSGAHRVVLLSSSSVPSGRTDNAIASYMIASERVVKDSGLSWTMLQPNAFASNALRWKPQLDAGDTIRDGFADIPLSVIHPGDIAAVAVEALTDDRHAGRSYRLSGPESLSTEERVRRLGAAIGRRLTFVPLSDREHRAILLETTPEPYVDAFFQFYRGGTVDETSVQPAFEHIMGRPPRRFAEWLAEHSDKF